jgi:hypothetical protein
VDDWAESDLAWELADAIRPVLGERDRVQLYGAIGSGESYTAIETVLQTIAHQRLSIPTEFIPKLTGWLDAYAHSDDAPRLRELLQTVKSLRCRFSNCVADSDASTSACAEFSSKWRSEFSHLCGGS